MTGIEYAKSAPLSKFALDFGLWAQELDGPIDWHDDTTEDDAS